MIKDKQQILEMVEASCLKSGIKSNFGVGDTIRVNFLIQETKSTKSGKKERVQAFEGIVIGMRGTGINRNIMVRKISHNVGVERIFSLHSPLLESIKVLKRGKIRRAKLYYLRHRVGKAAQTVKTYFGVKT